MGFWGSLTIYPRTDPTFVSDVPKRGVLWCCKRCPIFSDPEGTAVVDKPRSDLFTRDDLTSVLGVSRDMGLPRLSTTVSVGRAGTRTPGSIRPDVEERVRLGLRSGEVPRRTEPRQGQWRKSDLNKDKGFLEVGRVGTGGYGWRVSSTWEVETDGSSRESVTSPVFDWGIQSGFYYRDRRSLTTRSDSGEVEKGLTSEWGTPSVSIDSVVSGGAGEDVETRKKSSTTGGQDEREVTGVDREGVKRFVGGEVGF